MADKEIDIKSMIKLIISNIDEFDYEFITYKADSMKRLLEDTLEYINKKEQALDEIERFCKDVCDSCKKFTPNRQSDISCGLCQATQILNIINKVRGQINDRQNKS